MPWKEVTAVNERMEFVARLKAGERMSDLCREYEISRKTGYKFEQRYEEQGPKGLYDVSRRPRRLARQISSGIQTAILELKREKPTWGAAKIHEVLGRQHPQMELPVRSTIHDLGQPQQNGRHERMHRTLKEEILPRSAKNLLAQQDQLDRFREDFNERRPHEALKMKCPADFYKPSLKRYPDNLPEPVYSHHDLVRVVYPNGSVHFRGQNNFFISQALADQAIGFEEEQDGIWRINFMDLDLGFLDEETMKFSPISPEHSDHRLGKRDRGHSSKVGNKNA